KAENDVRASESTLQEREKQSSAQASRITQERAGLASAEYDLSKVRIESPIDGIVTRRHIQEGETEVIGTMNNPGTVLRTTPDMATAIRKNVTSVPIPAVAVRELIYDANGQVVKQPRDEKQPRSRVEPVAAAAELKPGQTRKETEGVFVVRSGRVEFVPIKM